MRESDHFLLIEDDPTIAELIGLVISDSPLHGANVDHISTLTDARKRIQELSQQPSDVTGILLNLDLYREDARELIPQVRQSDDTKFRQIPIIVISGRMDAQLSEELKAAGATDAISKPFDIDDLIGRLTTAFNPDHALPK